MNKSYLKEIFEEIFVDNYPGRLTLMSGYLKSIEDILFSEIDKTFNEDLKPNIPEFYWIRQAHCFLWKYQKALYFSIKEIEKRKDVIKELLANMLNKYERKISEFEFKLIEYCRKGEDLWGKLTQEGIIEGNLEKVFLCYRNKKIYQEEKKEIEQGILNHPYLFFDVEGIGIDYSLVQFAKTWKKYYHPIKNNNLTQDFRRFFRRLLIKNFNDRFNKFVDY